MRASRLLSLAPLLLLGCTSPQEKGPSEQPAKVSQAEAQQAGPLLLVRLTGLT